MRARSTRTLHGGSVGLLSFVISCCLLLGCTRSESNQQSVADTKWTVIRTASAGEMTLVAGGQFVMGDPHGSMDATPHEVRVDSFYMDRNPISQEFFERITGKNPSKRTGADNPVERVQWTDAVRFCNQCSELEGLVPCYDLETWACDFSTNGYRLPTEAEWEYACRAGSQTNYFFGDDAATLNKYAWFKPHSQGRPRAVGGKLPNPWGLHDMLGNVWEWCNDYYQETYYTESPRDNPVGPTTGKQRVLRGGAWSSPPEMCQVSVRFSEFQVFTDACFGSDSYGFRRVRGIAGAGDSPVDIASTTTATELTDAAQIHPSPPTATTTENTKSAGPVDSVGDSQPSITPQAPAQVALGNIDPERLTGTIVFVSDRAGSLDIWSMSARRQKLKQLTNDAHADADPRFSPAGTRVMYTTLRNGFPQIWTMDSTGTDQRFVTDGSQANWSPDGNSIVFIRDDQAYVRHLESGDEQRVTPQAWRRCGVPAWSPDGMQLAVASRHLERIGIFLFNISGTEHQQLKTEDACCTPQWSSDSSKIVFQTDKGHIHVHYTDDATEEQVTFGADVQHDARFSPDGSMIVYCRASSEDGPWQLWIADLESDDLDTVQLTENGSNRLPDWR